CQCEYFFYIRNLQLIEIDLAKFLILYEIIIPMLYTLELLLNFAISLTSLGIYSHYSHNLHLKSPLFSGLSCFHIAKWLLLPLHCRRGFSCDIVHDTVDTWNFIGNAF